MNVRLIAFRAAHGLTQKQAAAAFRVSHATWRGWERGTPIGPARGPLSLLLDLVEAWPNVWDAIAEMPAPTNDTGGE